MPIKHSYCTEHFCSLAGRNVLFCFVFSTAQITLKVFEKQGKLKLLLNFQQTFMHLDVKKLLLNKKGQILCSSQITMVPLISLGLGCHRPAEGPGSLLGKQSSV